jgi:hypothetical protein
LPYLTPNKTIAQPQGGILIPVEVGVKVTMSVKKESGETDSKTIPLKDFKSPNIPGSPEFWEDVLSNVAKYHLRPDPRQKQLSTEPGKPAEPLSKKLKKDKSEDSGTG